MEALDSIHKSSINPGVPCHLNSYPLITPRSIYEESVKCLKPPVTSQETSDALNPPYRTAQQPNPRETRTVENNMPKNSNSYRCFNDPVHGSIRLNHICCLIIDTPEFQRLRYLKQCGPCYFVYPSANHTRFDHSIGTCHLASKVLSQLLTVDGERVELEKNEKLCVEIAALCHDLGHGPFSHFWERFVDDKEFCHEKMSVEILKHIIKSDGLSDVFRENFTEQDILFIQELICPPKNIENRIKKNKPFLYEIVNNLDSKVDVDKLDYMLRDSHMFGVKTAVEPHRILAEVVVKDNHLYFPLKLKDSLREIFDFRSKMFVHGYQHKAAVNIELMYKHAVRLVDKQMGEFLFPDSYPPLKLSTAHKDVEAYLKLNDSIFQMIELLPVKGDSDVKKAKDLIHRVHLRKLYPLLKIEHLEKDDEIKRRKKDLSKEGQVEYCKVMAYQKKDPLSGVNFVDRQGNKHVHQSEDLDERKFSTPVYFFLIENN